MGMFLEILKKIQTIFAVLFEHKELFIIILTIVTIIIIIISNHTIRKINYISDIKNNTSN